MMKHLQEAFSFDIHIRRDVDTKFSPEGIKVVATDIRKGVVYEANGVKVMAFLVDHGPVKPAFGYRVDYRAHSVVLSGDTKPSDNLVSFSQGVDLLIHEFGRSKQDPLLDGPPDELLPGSRQTRGQAKTIAEHHTDGLEAERVLTPALRNRMNAVRRGVEHEASANLFRAQLSAPGYSGFARGRGATLACVRRHTQQLDFALNTPEGHSAVRELERARLLQEDTLCRDSVPGATREWMLILRYETELEPYITGRTPTWNRTTLQMWVGACWPGQEAEGSSLDSGLS